MLVLTRKQNEKIRIGDSITITVLRMKGKSIRLGIEAPHSVSVIRGELAFETAEDLQLEDVEFASLNAK
ncbi:MAG: carbon storage regulator [Pirellulales bacterium]|nr:carbon storage regulator [Pirellulales bacterium]